MGERCLTGPTLHKIYRNREWTGDGSTTQLLNGTMLEFLKLTHNYTIEPEEMAFAILGTVHHERLADEADILGLPAEVSLTDDEKNIFDLLTYDDGWITLVDYKTWGSFKLAKTLGIVIVEKEVVYYTDSTGKKRQKTINHFDINPDRADTFEIDMQLNRYRLTIEEKLGNTIDKMKVQVTVRDGGLYTATGYGVFKRMYLFPVARIDDDVVKGYFDAKNVALQQAMKHGSWDMPCEPYERWTNASGADIRCQRFCPVAEFCPYGKRLMLGVS
ncbi:hypothetical protein LCGC14_2100920 [marine sediment metagenome]|uniref:PD-(D/E)XK endonuclease-like domain-containing protein n=1 Tax=marine sediment metagenome TaxID=412755 RepID=A0A0F9EA49_9ZZZZ